MNKEIMITNLEEFIKIVIEEKDKCEYVPGFKKEILLFRGQPKKNLPIIPSLGRGRDCGCDISIFSQERNLIEMAKFKLPNVFNNSMRPIELLSKLQHYGIPTRLLDVTENALVALYFACVNDVEEDGEVIIFKDNEIDITNYPICEGIADSYKFAYCTNTLLTDFYKYIIEQPYFIEQKKVLDFKNNKEGGMWIKDCCNKPIFLYSNINLERQRIQKGRYVLFPNKIVNCNEYGEKQEDIWSFNTRLNEINREDDIVVKTIIIPAKSKKKMLKNLELFGISNEMLFCDNIDFVCEGIVNMFK